MESLPPEVVEIIAVRLTPQELSACCAVSVGWRDVFNQDSLWRHHCDQDTAEYLETAECRVEPGFVSPEKKRSKLSSVCRWRLCYMREIHLLNNWRHWKCVRHDIVEEVDNADDAYCFVSNDTLLTKDQQQTALWSVWDTPLSLGSPFRPLFDYCERHDPDTVNVDDTVCDCVMISEKTVVIVRHRIVEAYESAVNRKWFLKYFFYVGGTDIYSWKEADVTDESDEHDCTRSYYITGKYFVGLTNNDSNIIHIWDLFERKKLKRVECPVNYDHVDDTGVKCKIVKSEKQTMNLLLVVSYNTIRFFYVFSLSELQFLSFQTHHNIDCQFDCVLQDQFLAIGSRLGPLYIYNYMTSEVVITDIESQIDSGILPVGDHILIAKNGRLSSRFNTSTAMMEPLTVTGLDDSRSKIYIDERIRGFGRFFYTTNICKTSQLWEVGGSSSSGNITWVTDLACKITSWKINKSHTKVAVKSYPRDYFYELYILNFW